MTYKTLSPNKKIAMVAHDHRKDDLVNWALRNRDAFIGHELLATGTTGKLIEERLNLPVRKLLSGPLGGDQQIGALIAQGEIDVLIFFWDPMEAQPHDPDVKALLRIGIVWNIPMACDVATADFLISSPHMQGNYKVALTDYDEYKNRTF
ncbi:methylglyoxal synthase [Pedobacter endophyticus]|uniref:Methylglyoxal synthase n=1 Tax=Pedobacter endophyticus TaxID=2789740 RepID=A0A7S9PZ60_9SPHI|nr:methylglyoxal synthase [Pedobacter endophyticus]QPH39381.1 methylglyoxal synthase [Pedobacter endophyticus]